MAEEPKMMVTRDIESPRGGWKYTLPATGTLLKGEFFRDLYQNVRRHCVANSLEIPDKEEIEDAACREGGLSSPYCGKRPPKPAAGQLPFLTLSVASNFLRTVWEALKTPDRFVPKEEAQRRITICRGDEEAGIPPCPLATSIGGCVGCSGLLKEVAKVIPDNSIPDTPETRFCGACGCVLAAKVHLSNDVLDRAEKEKPLYAEGCWRHRA